MARIRTIKPEFWTDEKVVQLPFEARLMFIGMWNFADDDGFLVDEPERIRLQILPADHIDASSLVDLLVATGLLDRYLVDDGGFLRIKGFDTHQKISHKSPTKFPVDSGKKQNIPAVARRQLAQKYGCQPGKSHDASCYFCGSAGSITWWPLYNGKPSSWVSFSGLEIDHLVPECEGGPTTADNLVLSCRFCNRSRGGKPASDFIQQKFQSIPEPSRNLQPEGKGRERKGEDTSSLRSDDAHARAPSAFDKFWEAYPHKVGKLAAEKAFGKAKKLADLPTMLSAIDRYRVGKPPDREWCNPATWLNQGRWDDGFEPAGQPLPAAEAVPKFATDDDFQKWWAARRASA